MVEPATEWSLPRCQGQFDFARAYGSVKHLSPAACMDRQNPVVEIMFRVRNSGYRQDRSHLRPPVSLLRITDPVSVGTGGGFTPKFLRFFFGSPPFSGVCQRSSLLRIRHRRPMTAQVGLGCVWRVWFIFLPPFPLYSLSRVVFSSFFFSFSLCPLVVRSLSYRVLLTSRYFVPLSLFSSRFPSFSSRSTLNIFSFSVSSLVLISSSRFPLVLSFSSHCPLVPVPPRCTKFRSLLFRSRLVFICLRLLSPHYVTFHPYLACPRSLTHPLSCALPNYLLLCFMIVIAYSDILFSSYLSALLVVSW